LRAQPGPGRPEFLFDQAHGDPELTGDFLDLEVAKEAQGHDCCLLFIDLGKVVQGVVDFLQVQTPRGAVVQHSVEWQALSSAAPFFGVPPAGVFDQDPAHFPRRHPEEMSAVPILSEFIRAEKAKPEFVEKCGRLERMVLAFARHGQLVEFVTKFLEELIRRNRTTGPGAFRAGSRLPWQLFGHDFLPPMKFFRTGFESILRFYL